MSLREIARETAVGIAVGREVAVLEFIRRAAPDLDPVWWVYNDEPAPFLVRIIPFIGPLLKSKLSKHYVLVLSRKELAILHVPTRFFGNTQLARAVPKKIERIPLKRVQSGHAKEGTFTSSLTLTIDGQVVRFRQMLLSAPASFLGEFEDLTGRSLTAH